LPQERVMLARTEWIEEHPRRPTGLADRGFLRNPARVLRVWRHRIAMRDAMSNLTERDLRDARLTRADALAEIAKPFWRA
jgi:uncharacterized protein YjiS (DUF1127 family)